MSSRRYLSEDFKIDIKATPKKVDIKADGDEAKEVEDLARSMFGDDFDFFSAFNDEDKATEEVDEPIDNGFEEEEVEEESEEELTEGKKVKQYVHYGFEDERGTGPIDAMSDTPDGLAKKLGMTTGSVKSNITHGRPQFAKVEYDEDDEFDDIDLDAYEKRQAEKKKNLKECGPIKEKCENCEEELELRDTYKECGNLQENSFVDAINNFDFTEDFNKKEFDDKVNNFFADGVEPSRVIKPKSLSHSRVAAEKIIKAVKANPDITVDNVLAILKQHKLTEASNNGKLTDTVKKLQAEGKKVVVLDAMDPDISMKIKNLKKDGTIYLLDNAERLKDPAKDLNKLTEDAGEQFVIWFAFVADDWGVPKYLGEGPFNGNYDEYYVIDPRKAHRFNSLEEAQTWYDENQDDAFDESEFKEGEYHRVLSTNDPQYKKDVAKYNKRDYDKARYAKRKI